MDIRAIWQKANSLHGCLSHLKTNTSRRRYLRENDESCLLLRNPFVEDESRIVGSKAFRAAAGKTQVFSFPKTPLTRSRLAHLNEVAGTSVLASEMLGLNIDLIRAGALAHDLGHTPFGHQGEKYLQKALGRPDFSHEAFGVVICQQIERGGWGLNLTWHVLRMIARHANTTESLDIFAEMELLGLTDSITYLLADASDIGGRARYPLCPELRSILDYFGATHRERTNTLLAGVVIESAEHGCISFRHSELALKFRRLRELMYDVYHRVTQQNVEATMDKVLECLTRLNVGDPFMLLALMTDKDVAFIASLPMPDMQAFSDTAIAEIFPRLEEIYQRHGRIDLCKLDLKW